MPINTVASIADEIFNKLEEPSDTSVPAIARWLRDNLGELNSKIGTVFIIHTETDEISPTICDEEKSVLKKMFDVHYLFRQLKKTLGAGGVDRVIEVTDTGSTVRFVNRNELAKTYRGLYNDAQKDLNRFVKSYRGDKSVPRQVAGDDARSALGGISLYNDFERV